MPKPGHSVSHRHRLNQSRCRGSPSGKYCLRHWRVWCLMVSRCWIRANCAFEVTRAKIVFTLHSALTSTEKLQPQMTTNWQALREAQ